MADQIRCHAHPCRDPGHVHGVFVAPFCSRHMAALTPRKHALVLSIAGFSVLDVTARGRANAIILEARRYLAAKDERKSA